MEVHTNVAESDIGRLKPGMRVTFTVDAYPGEPFRGSIRDIRNAPQVVQNVVTYDAVIDVANDDLKLKPGMTATVSIVTDRRRDVLAVPNTALRFRPEGWQPAVRCRRAAAQRRRARASAANGLKAARARARATARREGTANPTATTQRPWWSSARSTCWSNGSSGTARSDHRSHRRARDRGHRRRAQGRRGDHRRRRRAEQPRASAGSSAAPEFFNPAWLSSNCAIWARSTSPATRNSPRCMT